MFCFYISLKSYCRVLESSHTAITKILCCERGDHSPYSFIDSTEKPQSVKQRQTLQIYIFVVALGLIIACLIWWIAYKRNNYGESLHKLLNLNFLYILTFF